MRTSRGSVLALNRRQDRRYMRNALRRIAALTAKGELERAEGIKRSVARIAMAQMIGQTWHGNFALQEQVQGSNESRARRSETERDVPF